MLVLPKIKVGKESQPPEDPSADEQPPKQLTIIARRTPGQGEGRVADIAFRVLVIACAVSLLAVVVLILLQLVRQSGLSRHKFGFSFLSTSLWNPVSGEFGAMPFIYGTLVSSFLGLLIAVPLSLGTALFLTELCPPFLRRIFGTTVELLAAIPSVIYGLWGIFVLAPVLRTYVEPWLQHTFGWTGLFSGPPLGVGMLAAGIILAIMVLPIIASVTREVILAVPRQQREAVLALGATKWETLRMGVLRNARIGIIGAVILGLGRAVGETMAVTMVIGNNPAIVKSLLAPGNTLASVVALEFSEAVDDLHLSSLIEVALVLFVITLIVNALARFLVWSVTRGMPTRTNA
jgi:phosphate transport system permease protein